MLVRVIWTKAKTRSDKKTTSRVNTQSNTNMIHENINKQQ